MLDIFKGEWSSQLPEKFGLDAQPGTAKLFGDAWVIWAEEILGNFTNWKILELGSLEGGRSYMVQDRAIDKAVSIEANTRAFFKMSMCKRNI